MCDYSLQTIRSRSAKVGDKLKTRNFGTGTTGFCSLDDETTAVCLLPGTEISFDEPVVLRNGTFDRIANALLGEGPLVHTTAIFRQVHKDQLRVHHDMLEFPDGHTRMLTSMDPDIRATVLQLPAAPKTSAEVEEQKRAEYV